MILGFRFLSPGYFFRMSLIPTHTRITAMMKMMKIQSPIL